MGQTSNTSPIHGSAEGSSPNAGLAPPPEEQGDNIIPQGLDPMIQIMEDDGLMDWYMPLAAMARRNMNP